MIKDVFKLNPDAWHARYMEWIWDFHYTDFANMCPYFWLSVFNVVFTLIPIIPLVKLIIYVVKKTIAFFKKMNEEQNAKLVEKIKEALVKKDLDFLLKMYARAQYDHPTYTKRFNNFWYYWLDYDLRNDVDNLVYDTYSKNRKTAKDTSFQKQIERKKRIGILTTRIKQAARILGLIAFVGVLVLAYFLISKLVGTFGWSKIFSAIGQGLLWIVGIILFVLLCSLILNGLAWLFNKAFPVHVRSDIGTGFGKGFKFMATPFIWIGNGFGTLIEIIVAFKENNCPAIEWESDEKKRNT
jgi:uncharacterized membrane protein